LALELIVFSYQQRERLVIPPALLANAAAHRHDAPRSVGEKTTVSASARAEQKFIAVSRPFAHSSGSHPVRDEAEQASLASDVGDDRRAALVESHVLIGCRAMPASDAVTSANAMPNMSITITL